MAVRCKVSYKIRVLTIAYFLTSIILDAKHRKITKIFFFYSNPKVASYSRQKLSIVNRKKNWIRHRELKLDEAKAKGDFGNPLWSFYNITVLNFGAS